MRNKARRLFNADSRGFTLVEVMIAMAIVGAVVGAIYSIFISSNRSYRTQDSIADAQQRVRIGLDFMVRDIRMAGLDPAGPATDAVDSNGAGIKLATASKIRFTIDADMDGAIEEANSERMSYEYDNGAGQLKRILYEGTGSQSTQSLIGDVSAMSFSYLDANGAAIALPVSAASLANIRTVVISITCQGTDAQGQNFTRTLNTRVSCRNLGL
ncbi:MAG: prepilin-type N-terminal cleavage/methylation domain-containing protein [Planctomycetota bacterium]